MFFVTHLYNSDSFLENVDLQEVEAIYPHVTDTPRDFSNEFFQEFSEFILQGNDHDDILNDVVSGLHLFLYLKGALSNSAPTPPTSTYPNHLHPPPPTHPK